ncbi:efflux RND transporter periplasmic adaptor subunit [Spartinivicinus poritis]|uniref:Efflux RND transporter periplasmic adaptor subunit n=1 Tax=Spartinivicinus poritis TaxID=2994640 RepID=A0ABT5UDT7_9GAMM|nr:efflux RND transporter periplasmic adaptor subunit [Spartinivicinus sp. A2-2]MDE1464544.1 efflux RND transporter periplasmic adaptor subunit [Spartinivicinus sp. A2-2]
MRSLLIILQACITISLTATTQLSWSDTPTLVSAKTVNQLQFYPEQSAPAKVVALNQSQIPAEINARLIHMPVNVGDLVKQGALLAKLDCQQTQFNQQSQQAKYAQLQSLLAFNQRELKRSEKLARQKNIGEAEFDRNKTNVADIQAQLQAQQAALAIAKLNTQYCQITAPFAGLVTKKMADVGEMLAIGTPVIELLQTNQLEVSAQIALTDERSFKQAQSFSLKTNGEQYPLQLRSFLPFIENSTRSREARLVFTSNNTIAGTTGRLQWKSPTPHLPAHLLQKRNGKYGVFIIHDNKAQFIAAEQAQEGRPIPLSIATDQLVVIDGRHGLVEGQTIKLTNAKEQNNNVASQFN